MATLTFAQNAYVDGLNTALRAASQRGDVETQRDLLQELANSYYHAGDYETAYAKHLLFANFKDSIFNTAKSVEEGKLVAKFEKELMLEERAFQMEQEVKRRELEVKRRDNLQQFGIFIFLVILIIGVFMSGKFRMSLRFAEGLIFFTFLLLFEFSLVLLDPYTESLSSGSPAIKLGINALLAGIIFPLHQFFESTLKNRVLTH